MGDFQPPDAPAAERSESRRLGSWKEIARYLGRTVRTVQRWEENLGLPVRRLQHDSGSSVFAYTHELDRWLTRRSLVVHDGKTAPTTEPVPADAVDAADAEPLKAAERRLARRRRILYGVAALAAIAAVPMWYILRGQPAGGVHGHAFVPRLLTTDPGIERFPALSPDGRQVVYTWDGDRGQVDLYLRLVDVEEHIRLTQDAAIEESPAWSPDGLAIAFIRRSGTARRELRIIPAIGGQERLVAAFDVPVSLDAARSMSASASWSPDGQWIAYTRAGEQSESLRLSAVNIETGAEVDLTAPEAGVSDISPHFSPDGRLLAFARSPSSLSGSLQVMEFDATAPGPGRSWTLPDATPWNSEPAWTPDGRSLVFSSGRWPRTGLWQLPADGSALPLPLTAAGQGGSQPSLAPVEPAAGKNAPLWRLVYPVIALENDIWQIGLGEGAEDRSLLSTSQRERFPAFASDGRIAFLSDRSGDREIWVADSDGQNWQQWTRWRSAYIWRPSFSPDSRHLAYTVEIGHVMRLHVQDGPLAPARDLSGGSANDTDLAWSRDGRRIYVASTNRDEGGHGVWAVPADGAEATLVRRGEGLPLGEGPDGRWLYLTRPDPNRPALQRLDLQSGALETIELEGAQLHSHTLGPDGVYYVALIGDSWSVHRWSWADGVASRLRTLDHEPETGMAIAPDGRRALLARIILRRSDLMVAEGRF